MSVQTSERVVAPEYNLSRRAFLLLLVGLLALLSSFNEHSRETSFPFESTAALATHWLERVQAVAEEGAKSENVAIRSSMETIRLLATGQAVTWEDCPGVSMKADFVPRAFYGKALMAIGEDFTVEKDAQVNELEISVSWIIVMTLWELWQAQRTEMFWHESGHIHQICQRAMSVDWEQDSEGITQDLRKIVQKELPHMEAELLGIQVYWYLATNDQDEDLVINWVVSTEFPHTYLDIWSYFFSTIEPRKWEGLRNTPLLDEFADPQEHLLLSDDGRPLLQRHPNWQAWVDAIADLYVVKPPDLDSVR